MMKYHSHVDIEEMTLSGFGFMPKSDFEYTDGDIGRIILSVWENNLHLEIRLDFVCKGYKKDLFRGAYCELTPTQTAVLKALISIFKNGGTLEATAFI